MLNALFLWAYILKKTLDLFLVLDQLYNPIVYTLLTVFQTFYSIAFGISSITLVYSWVAF